MGALTGTRTPASTAKEISVHMVISFPSESVNGATSFLGCCSFTGTAPNAAFGNFAAVPVLTLVQNQIPVNSPAPGIQE